MPKRKKTEAAAQADVPVPTTVIETAPVAVTEPPAKPKRKRPAKADTTLATVFAGYLQALDERGGSTGTIASYRAELEMAGKALGVETPVSNLTDAQVAVFFDSDPVTKKRNGKSKSSLSIDKTRRVLRQALVWAGHADLVPSMEAAS